jgi:hypothetical protein
MEPTPAQMIDYPTGIRFRGGGQGVLLRRLRAKGLSKGVLLPVLPPGAMDWPQACTDDAPNLAVYNEGVLAACHCPTRLLSSKNST